MKSSDIEHKLLQINIVQKLKAIKGMNFVKKLANLTQVKQLAQLEAVTNENNQTYIAFTIKGNIEVNKRKKGQLQSQKIKPYSYILVDKMVVKILALQQCCLLVLPQKYIIQIFEGVISLPFINIRLNQLKKNQVFELMQKRKLVKIAFDLHQLHLKIGSKVLLEENENDNQRLFCYYIVYGELKIFSHGIPVCMIGSTEIFAPQMHQVAYKSSTGQIITQYAHIYKIPAELVFDSNKNVEEYIEKRAKWRQSRVFNICKISTQKNKIQKALHKQGKKYWVLQNILDYANISLITYQILNQ